LLKVVCSDNYIFEFQSIKTTINIGILVYKKNKDDYNKHRHKKKSRFIYLHQISQVNFISI